MSSSRALSIPQHPARLHPALVAFDASRRPARHRPVSATPVLLLIAVGLWAAHAAEFTTEAWPLAVMIMLPVIGFIISWRSRRRPRPAIPQRRPARVVIDHRPFLLQRIIVLPPQRRRRRITGVLPQCVKLDATQGKPSRGVTHRQARLLTPVHSA